MKKTERVAYMRDLAERFFLSYETVVAARAIFDEHRALNGSSSQTPAATAAASLTTDLSPADASVPLVDGGASPTPAHHQSGADAESARPVASTNPRVVATATVVVSGPTDTAQEATSSDDEPVGHRLQAGASAPMMYAAPWEGDERIGVIGLETVLRLMGCPLSRLEVADLIDVVHGTIPLLTTLHRAVEEEEEAAAEERCREEQLLTQSHDAPRHARRSRAGSVSSTHSASAQRKLGTSSGKSVRSARGAPQRPSVNAFIGSGRVEPTEPQPTPAVRGQLGEEEGLTFPEFLHVLQLPLVPDDSTTQAHDALLASVFGRIDADHDGVLSELDVVTTLRGLIYDEQVLANNPTVRQLAMMYPTELQTALAECDVDGDGIVTLRDLAAVLQ